MARATVTARPGPGHPRWGLAAGSNDCAVVDRIDPASGTRAVAAVDMDRDRQTPVVDAVIVGADRSVRPALHPTGREVG